MKKAFLTLVLVTPLALLAQVSDSAKREIKLQGAVNFRDLGGYETSDGRHVKWGRIYRSAAINSLTDSDLNTLHNLSLSRVADFRGPYEVKAAPDKLPSGATRISLPAGSENIGDSNYMKNLVKLMHSDSSLIFFYSDITPFTARYKPMFDQLLELNSDSAFLFHCTAGKDRTGIAAALILYALGVDEKTIMNDYLATNYYRSAENKRAITGMVKFYHLDSASAAKMMAALPEYLQSTFIAIRSQYGSVDNYLAKEMGLDEKKLTKLKQLYLE